MDIAPQNESVTGKEPAKKENFFVEAIKFIILALAIVIPVRYLIAQPFVVSGASMYPTFENGQYLIVNEITYRFGSPKRFDPVIFKYPKDESIYFIKRVIGLPGETVTISGNQVLIKNDTHPEGFVLDEPYVKNESRTEEKLTIKLKSDQYFVMGDNRPASSDSRVWGPVPEKDIVGVPILRLTPVSDIGVFPGAYSVEQS